MGAIIKEYRAEVLTFASHNIIEQKKSTHVESIDDDNVNRFFGWAVMKLKKYI